jgi:hypothetical protein
MTFLLLTRYVFLIALVAVVAAQMWLFKTRRS